MESKYVYVKYPFSFVTQDYPDNCSFSLILYLAGCEHFCKNCQNPSFQNIEPSNKDLVSLHTNTLLRHVDQYMLFNKEVTSIVISGGDPLYENNEYFTKKLCIEYGEKYSIAIFTGYEIDYVKQIELTGFKFIKCGKYDENLKQESYKNDYEMQLASSNQEWYNSSYERISEKGLLRFY